MTNRIKAILALFTSAFVWGFGFISVDAALAGGWEAFPLLMARGFIGGLAMLVFSYKKKWWKNKSLIKLGFISGSLFFIGFAFQTTGQSLSSVPNSAFITALNILFVPLISKIVLHKNIPGKIYTACIIALIGTAILTFDGTLALHIGDILLLFCAIGFASQIIYNEKCGEANDVLSITCIQLFTMGFLSLLCMPLSNQMTIPTTGWSHVLYLALISSALASVCQLYGQTHIEPSKASLILCMESPIATFLSVILLGQELTLSIIIGGILITFAVIMTETDFI